MSTPFFRAIPILMMVDGELYKSSRFKKYKYIGDPINAVKIFNEKEVDELVILDVSASKDKKDPDYDLLGAIASEAFMPVAYGGGISSLEHAKRVFNLGVEKVILNTGFLNNRYLIEQISQHFGVQSVLVSIDYEYNFWGKRKVYSHTGCKIPKGTTVESLIESAMSTGVAEVVLTCVSRDGSMGGLDIEYLAEVSNKYKVNLIPVGGVGSYEDILKVSNKTKARACGAGSYFVYQDCSKSVMINYLSEEQKKKLG